MKLAFQILSGTMAAGLNLYIWFGKLPEDAIATPTFVDMLNKLFDFINNTASTVCTKKFKKPSSGLQYQIDFLNTCLNYFVALQVQSPSGEDMTRRVKFITRWKIPIKSIISIQDVLKAANQGCLWTFSVTSDSKTEILTTQHQFSFKERFGN